MGGKFFVSGDPFIFQELQNSRVLSLQGLHRGEQVVKDLLHKINILVHIPLLFETYRWMQKKPTRDVAVESHPNVEKHDVRMGHPVFRISQGTGEDARLSTSVQNYIGNSRRTYSIAASRDARRP